jgi:flagellar biosynthesis protein FliP
MSGASSMAASAASCIIWRISFKTYRRCTYKKTSIPFSTELSSHTLSYARSTPLPKRILHRVQSSASSFNYQYLVVSLRSSISWLRLLPLLLFLSIFPSIMCVTGQFLRKMWSIQLAFLRFTVCRCSPPPWLCVILLPFRHIDPNF